LPGSSTSSTSTGSTGGSTSGATNVVVYNVIIDVDNPQLKLRPGMTANVNFTVDSTDDVLKVPNAALRYRPGDKDPDEIHKLQASSGTVSADSHNEGNKSQPQTTPKDGAEAARNGQNPTGGGFVRSRSGKILGKQTTGAQAIVTRSTNDRYGINAGLTIHFPQADPLKASWGMVWVLDSNGQPQPRRVKLGITDGRETAVMDGDLKEGEMVITGELNDTTGAAAQQTTSPFRGPFGRPAGSTASKGGRH